MNASQFLAPQYSREPEIRLVCKAGSISSVHETNVIHRNIRA